MHRLIAFDSFFTENKLFGGHDESRDSNNQGSFLEFLQFLFYQNEDIKSSVLRNASENLKLTALDI